MSVWFPCPPGGLPTFDRFPWFSALLRFAEQVFSICCRKRLKAIKVGHSCCYLPRARSFEYLRQSTKYACPLDLAQQAKPRDARPRVKTHGDVGSHHPHIFWPMSYGLGSEAARQLGYGSDRRRIGACPQTFDNTHRFNPRARVSALLIAARGQGIKCVLSIVANIAGARPREAGQVNGLFVRFLKIRRAQMEDSGSQQIVHAPEFRESHKGWTDGERQNPKDENNPGPVTGNYQHCRTVFLNWKWAESCFKSRSNLPAPLCPRRSRPVLKSRCSATDH